MSTPSQKLAFGILALSSFAPATIHGQPVEKPSSTPMVSASSSTQAIQKMGIAGAVASLVVVIGAISVGNNRRNCSHQDLNC